MKTCLLVVKDLRERGPDYFVAQLQAAGFEFESVECPIKLKKPWDSVIGGDGMVVYRQWTE